MNTFRRLAITSALLAVFPFSVSAGEKLGDFTLGGSATLATDYVSSGVSQTGGEPTVQVGFDLVHTSGFHANIWAANVDFMEENPDDRAAIEIDYTLGFGGSTPEGFTYDLSVLYYQYPGANNDYDYDYYEIIPAIGMTSGDFSLGLKYKYAPEAFASEDSSHIVQLSASYVLPDTGLSFGAGFGYNAYDDEEAQDYNDYNVFAGYDLSGFVFKLTYTNTDLENKADLEADGRVVFSVSKSF